MSIVQTADFILNEDLEVDKLGSILTDYITKYERIILSKVLGYQLYKEFFDAIDGGSPALKWTDLRDGKKYEWNGEQEYFEGLKYLIVDYVYFKFIKENSQYSSSVGIKKVNTENSQNADPSYKQQIANNEMVDINDQLYQFITATNNETEDTYENFRPTVLEKITHFNF